MATYFKAIRPDGASFHDPSFMWATEVGGVTYHPTHGKSGNTSTAAGYLSVSTTATDCTGMRWPCRLLEVEPVGEVFTPDPAGLPNKRAGLVFRTVRELPATDALGPQGVHLVALIERCAGLADDDARKLRAARGGAWGAAGAAGAAWDAARDAGAAWDAAWALVVRDLIGDTFTQAHYDTLTMPWRTVIGPIHPDDAAVS